MAYATVTAFNAGYGDAELIGLTDRAANAAVNTTIANDAFDRADAEIHSYIAAQYTVPIAPAPKRLIEVACDIARYKLHDDAPPDEVVARYKAAVAWLRDVSAGRALIVADSGSPIATSSGTGAGVAVGTRVPVVASAEFETAYRLKEQA